MMPLQVSVTGTANSTAFLPDIFQNPFQIGVGVTATGAVINYSVQHTFDFTTVMSPTWNGTTANWQDNSGATNTTSTALSANYAFPVAAIRLSVHSAVSTTVVVLNLLQASNAP